MPRVDDRGRDEYRHARCFSSHILPPRMRRSPKVTEVVADLLPAGVVSGGLDWSRQFSSMTARWLLGRSAQRSGQRSASPSCCRCVG